MDYVIIDVREPDEFASGHVAGALNIPPPQLLAGDARLKEVPADAPIIVYCRTGSRSAVAINVLRDLGYTNLTNGINKDQVEVRYGK